MTDPSEPRPDEEAVEATGAEPPPGPGQRLRQARLRRGLDLTQVARDLRLTPERVKAIENEDYSRLPDVVFVVGYVKTYARLLDLDPEALGEAYRAALAPPARKASAPPAAPPRQAARPATPSENRPSHRSAKPGANRGPNESHWAGFTALLLVLILVLAWWLQRPAEQDATSPPVAEKPVPDTLAPPQARVDEAAEEEAGADTSLDESPLEPLDEPPEETEVIVEEEEAAPNAPTGDLPADTPASPPQGEHEADVAQVVEKLDVVISFTGPTSVDIRDSTMNYGLIGEMDQGDQHLLGGKPPYSLIIGNAAATRIQVGGQPFDFQSVVRGNVARFILDPAPKP